jgi:YidC/Oxa1 family membrane protein insertase
LSEILNPNNPIGQAKNAGGEIRSMLAFMMLASMLLLGYHYLYESQPATPQHSSQIQPPTNQPVPSQSAAPKPIAAAARESETAGRSLRTKTQFGWLTFLAKPLYVALKFLHDHGVSNWGWTIILFTSIFNSVMVWPRMMSMKSSLKMMRLQPKVNDLKKRYAHLKIDDPKRAEMNTEMMALYKAEGANMYNGSLPILLQTPLLFAYASVLRNADELHHAHWFWIADLASPDPLHLLPLFIIVSMFLTQYITPAPGIDPTQRRILAILMPVVMGFTLWRYASGLALYWATGNLINLIVQLIINRSKLGQEMQAIAANRRP